MISDQAGRALNLIQGIEVCKQDSADFWRGAVVRIVMDLDEVAAERDLTRIADMLAESWRRLPDKPGNGAEGQDCSDEDEAASPVAAELDGQLPLPGTEPS